MSNKLEQRIFRSAVMIMGGFAIGLWILGLPSAIFLGCVGGFLGWLLPGIK